MPKLGPKAYEQCAGFLRVPESREVLDHTGVHPESYAAAKNLLKLCGYDKTDIPDGLSHLTEKMEQIGFETLERECGVGELTLRDIARELQKPGRDPRDELPAPILRKDVLELKDLKPGMVLTGTVRNVIDFGAFVDIGVHHDALVHISQIAPRRIKHPMKDLKPGMVLTGTVRNVIDFGAFVDIGVHHDALVHISQIAPRRIKHPSEVLKVGDVVKVAVLDVDEKRGRIGVTMKNLPKEG